MSLKLRILIFLILLVFTGGYFKRAWKGLGWVKGRRGWGERERKGVGKRKREKKKEEEEEEEEQKEGDTLIVSHVSPDWAKDRTCNSFLDWEPDILQCTCQHSNH